MNYPHTPLLIADASAVLTAYAAFFAFLTPPIAFMGAVFSTAWLGLRLYRDPDVQLYVEWLRKKCGVKK